MSFFLARSYFPTQALNFAFKDFFKATFKVPKTAPYWKQMSANLASGGAAGASSLLFVYSLDYARTRLANDAKSAAKGGGERQFNGLVDVYRKTLASDGIAGLYRGFVPSVVGIIVYRGLYFGMYDSLKVRILSFLILSFFITLTSSYASPSSSLARSRATSSPPSFSVGVSPPVPVLPLTLLTRSVVV